MSNDIATATTFDIAIYEYAGDSIRVRAIAKFDTQADADAVAATFPKSARVRSKRMMNGLTTVAYYFVEFEAIMRGNAANGEKNESGYKRFVSFERAAAKAGYAIANAEGFQGGRPMSREELTARCA